MLDKLKNLFKKSPPPEPPKPEPKPKRERKPRERKSEPPKLSDKELATKNGEPYIAILKVDIDPNNINAGGFEMDWNDKFVLNLIKSGYKQRDDDTDQVIVDRWFQTVCRNIALEVYEQQASDPRNQEYDELRRVRRRDLGGGRSEVS
jgi:hypothetical protein